ncbi:MAG: DUF3160 domain-containing protein [Sedimentisphaerales bacterium]|nr:DUF3160 domain-containing protein [Sedimentisphaerales bacterium]
MQKKSDIIIMMIFVLLMSVQSRGEKSNGQDWRRLAQKENLSENTIEKLAANNAVITDTAYKQIFTPYIEGGSYRGDRENEISLFITADSLINAYHVLYEESVLRLENANANKLEEILKFVLTNLPKADDNIKGKSELLKAARQRAFIIVGTAIKLMDENYRLSDKNIEEITSKEVVKIKQAAAKEKPSWLGEPTPDLVEIDYSRYKPRSFYTSSEKLSKYFCAVSWLQSIPFRLAKDDELLSMLMLGNCLNSKQFGRDSVTYQKYTDFFSTFKKLIGSGDDWDVITAKDQIARDLSLNLNGNDLDEIRQKLVDKLRAEGGSQINDQMRFPPLDPHTAAAEPQFRFISAYRTPDAVLFHRTTDLREFSRPLPTGLEVCAALGSEFARNKLEYSDKAKLLKTIENTRSVFSGNSLYLDYLQCLACLLDEPPAKSPAFMKNEIWQAKSCNTTLAGWSQLRHTWALQAKQSVTYGGDAISPLGFVEPEPEFYHKMALLAQKSRDILEKAGTFRPDYSEISKNIMDYVHIAETVDSELKLSQKMFQEYRKESERLYIGNQLMIPLDIGDRRENKVTPFKEKIAKLKIIAEGLQKGIMPEDEEMASRIKQYDFDLKDLWNSLESLSQTLVEISRKQLADEDLKEYAQFIVSYGVKIANIMMYNGNSYLNPNDDSMKIVDVHYKPKYYPGDSEGYLQIGIARPRAIYILYPWQGSLVLCRGAVMPYYEFKSDSRLTDAEWKTFLDTPQRPEVPEWIKPVVADGTLSLPSFVR